MSAQAELDFPDPDEGRRRRDEAIRRVTTNATEQWKAVAWEALLCILEAKLRLPVGEDHFTSEDIRELLLEWGWWPPPNDPRANTYAIVRARAEGLIELAPARGTSVFASSHGMTKNVWRPKR